MSGLSVADVRVAEIYDCFTFTTLITLEDYGFCEKGEGGAFAASGALAPGGSIPTNTGGGQLSSYYMWGMTPLSEGVIQGRGQGGERQVADNEVILVSGNGGCLDYHSTLLLSPRAN
jgi:acetyl-CoA acetyltransferase